MTLEEAARDLAAAGLYVRVHGDAIIGGSHYDASGPIRIIENGFGVFSNGGTYEFRTVAHAQGPGVSGLSLERAVELVLETVSPQPNVEAAPRPKGGGPVRY